MAHILSQPITIRGLHLANRVFLAPMAGVTDSVFRVLCREQGCAFAVSEMVSAKGLMYRGKGSYDLLRALPEDTPLGAQLFGSDPGIMACMAEEIAKTQKHIRLIDINMGCPARKIVSNGEGSALLRDIEKAMAIVKAVRSAVDLPLSVKFRKGFNNGDDVAVEFAQAMEQSGADVICLHPRTRSQMYSGSADWQAIAAVVRAVSIPVIGNGDIMKASQALEMAEQTGCAAVMAARGTQGNPWIFSEILHLAGGQAFTPPDMRERADMAIRHGRLLCEYTDQRHAVLCMRRHACWYMSGCRGIAQLRQRIQCVESISQLEDVLKGVN